MTHALDLTLPLKQDAASQAALAQLAIDYETKIQPKNS